LAAPLLQLQPLIGQLMLGLLRLDGQCRAPSQLTIWAPRVA
jgi:hypothetical protein